MDTISTKGLISKYIDPVTNTEIKCRFTSDLIPTSIFKEISPYTNYYTGTIQRPGNKEKNFIIGIDAFTRNTLSPDILGQYISKYLTPHAIRKLREQQRIRTPAKPKENIGYAGELSLNEDGTISHSTNPFVTKFYNNQVMAEKTKNITNSESQK